MVTLSEMDVVRRGFVLSPDGNIEYRELGEGPPLVLLHALPQSSRAYHRVMWRVAQGRRVIAMSLMGCGDSDRPPTPYASLDQFGQTVAWLLDGLEIERADLFATHTGASVAVPFAADHPDRLRRLILQEVFNYPAADDAARERLHRAHHYYPLRADGSHLVELWRRHGGDRPGADLYRAMEATIDHLKLNSDEGVEELYGDWGWEGAASFCMLRYNHWEALPRIEAPTLVAHGTGSVAGVQHERFVELIPHAEGTRPESEARLTPTGNPEQWAAMVNGFLTD